MAFRTPGPPIDDGTIHGIGHVREAVRRELADQADVDLATTPGPSYTSAVINCTSEAPSWILQQASSASNPPRALPPDELVSLSIGKHLNEIGRA